MKSFFKKTRKFILLAALFCFALWLFAFTLDFSSPNQALGITFTKSYAEYLGLDWRAAYVAVLDDLEADNIRLGAYWNEIEKRHGTFDFFDLDWMVQEASNRNVSITLAVGRRLPRWPECHDPYWLKELDDGGVVQEALREYMAQVILRYKDNTSIVRWQVENEPYVRWFGECPLMAREQFLKEVALVRELDTRPVMTTDSGEWSMWLKSARDADVLGYTLYRVVWSRWFGFWNYFYVPPSFYSLKASLIKIFRPHVKEVIISELQMEPWAPGKNIFELTQKEQERSFDLNRFRSNLRFARRTGAKEIYFWGVEYWYWLKNQGKGDIWEEARKLW